MAEMRLSAASMRIVKLLVGRSPQTVTDLIRQTKVTRTAVTEQLNELLAADLIQRKLERLPGRGRPRHRYSATLKALQMLFAGQEHLVVPAMWKAIAEIGGSELTRKVVRKVTRSLAEQYRARVDGRTPEERFVQMVHVMREEGALVDTEKDREGHLVMRKRSCPFISMFEESQTVCGLDQDLISAVVGAPVSRIAHRHKGDPCCAFRLHASNGK